MPVIKHVNFIFNTLPVNIDCSDWLLYLCSQLLHPPSDRQTSSVLQYLEIIQQPPLTVGIRLNSLWDHYQLFFKSEMFTMYIKSKGSPQTQSSLLELLSLKSGLQQSSSDQNFYLT